jgi:hypothetical protein
MYGAAKQLRLQYLRAQGVHLPVAAAAGHPLEPEALREALKS